MDIPLFKQWIETLLSGQPVTKKIYKFGKEPDEVETINPPRVIIAEGIHALHETLNDIPGLRIFVDATTHCRFIRRMYRDALKGRTGQTLKQVFRMFFETVEPSHQQWIEPARSKAHMIVTNTYDPLREASSIEQQDIQLKVRGHASETLLLSLGAHFVFEGPQLDTYYMPPNLNVTNRGEILRIRRNGPLADNLLFTYKAILPSGQVRFDTSIAPHDLELFNNSYRPFATIRKRRKKYVFGNIAVNLDTVEGMEEWTEFCASSPKHAKRIPELMRNLGIDPSQATDATYLSMIIKTDK